MVLKYSFETIDENLFGDFEDLETGESTMQARGGKADRDGHNDEEEDDDGSSRDGNKEEDDHERRLDKKKKLKENFNIEYPFIFTFIRYRLINKYLNK